MFDHGSARRFSTGVPDNARRHAAGRVATDLARLVAEFLSARASSNTKVDQLILLNSSSLICASA